MSATNGHDTLVIEETEALTAADVRQAAELAEQQRLGEVWTNIYLQERIAALEFALQDDIGWTLIGSDTAWEFSRDHLRTIIARSRSFSIKNPIIKNALQVQANYVMGQGITVSATAAPVNDVVQAFLQDASNRAELTSPVAQREKEIELAATGNLFIVMFPNRRTGRVRVRSVVVDEIVDIITNPDDRREPWYYKRTWSQNVLSETTGTQTPNQMTAYYPDWRYTPKAKPDTIGPHPVVWESPMAHLPINRMGHMRFGIPDTYAGLDWALEATRFHEDGATIRRAQARFAATITRKDGKGGVAATKAMLGTTMGLGDSGTPETNPPPLPGSTYIGTDMASYNLLKMAGNAPDPKEGTGIIHMAAAAMGIPETMLIGKVDVGNRATATSLDRPTELKMRSRQTFWSEFWRDLLDYVVDCAVRATKPVIAGKVTTDDEGREVIVLGPDPTIDAATAGPDYDPNAPMDRQINIAFGEVLERSVKERIEAIVSAATLAGNPLAGVLTPQQVTQKLLEALGFDDIDEEMEAVYPPTDQAAQDVTMADAALSEAVTGLKMAVLALKEGRVA